jgi:hypothetical protein
MDVRGEKSDDHAKRATMLCISNAFDKCVYLQIYELFSVSANAYFAYVSVVAQDKKWGAHVASPHFSLR